MLNVVEAGDGFRGQHEADRPKLAVQQQKEDDDALKIADRLPGRGRVSVTVCGVFRNWRRRFVRFIRCIRFIRRVRRGLSQLGQRGLADEHADGLQDDQHRKHQRQRQRRPAGRDAGEITVHREALAHKLPDRAQRREVKRLIEQEDVAPAALSDPLALEGGVFQRVDHKVRRSGGEQRQQHVLRGGKRPPCTRSSTRSAG